MYIYEKKCKIIDVAYGIGAIKRNVKNVTVFSRYYVENTKITPSTRLDILLRNRK
jgi:hypothetical protein